MINTKGIPSVTDNKINVFNILIRNVLVSNTFINLQLIVLYYS